MISPERGNNKDKCAFNNLQVREIHTMGNESKENKITDDRDMRTLYQILKSFIALVGLSVLTQNRKYFFCKGIPETTELQVKEIPMWFRWMLLQYVFFVLIKIFLIN